MSRTVHGVLERNARKYPDKEAFISATSRLTYAEMNKICNQIARCTQSAGLRRGDRVAILARNHEHFFFALFSLMKVGAIPMPINVRLTANELTSILSNSHASGLIFEREFQETANLIASSVSLWHMFNLQETVLQSVSHSPENLNISIDSQEICEILFTSGTTGAPKGVLFNHERILATASAISYEFQLSHNDKMLTLMPLTHAAPLNTFFMSGLYSGCSHVIGNFSPKEFLAWIDQEKTTFMFAAPVAYLLVSKEAEVDQYDLSSTRVFAYGGGPLALASYERVRDVFHNGNFYQVYGLTEAGPNGSLLGPEGHVTKPGSIGKYPTINMEFRVVRSDGSDTLPMEYGEIIMSGDSLMLGYDQNPEETNCTIREGWLHTGDIAYKDEDGYLFVVDRKKDVIISGGVNVYPREIEEVLAKHPAVLEACVIGVPHEEWGETVKAVIVLRGEVMEAELRDYVSAYLADYKRPRIYTFEQELPRNASGKVLKQQVKRMGESKSR